MSAKNQTVAVPSGGASTVNPRAFGAIGDGSGHPISASDLSRLPATTLDGQAYEVGDQWDFVGLSEAIRAAFAAGGSTPNGAANVSRNKVLHIPAGLYVVNKAPTLYHAWGPVVRGDGRFATTITALADVPAFQIDGAFFGEISGIRFQAGAQRTYGVVEIDGNIGGVGTQSVQGMTFQNCTFDGAGLAQYGTAICRRGGSAGMGSNLLFTNCFWQSALFACYWQFGMNALANTILNGDMQAFQKHGIHLESGSLAVYNTSFESTVGYTQILNDGWDIDCSTGGTRDRIIVDGCRSESLHFYRGSWSQSALIRGCSNWNLPHGPWYANSNYGVNTLIHGSTGGGNNHLYRCTTAGVSGASEPVWPESGAVSDGTVGWEDMTYNVVEIQSGSVTDCIFGNGAQVKGTINNGIFFERNAFERDDYRAPGSEGVYVNNYRLPFRVLQ